MAFHPVAQPLPNLRSFHTFAFQATCQQLAEIRCESELEVLTDLHPKQRFLILGEGSNVIFVDDFDGTVVRIQTKGISLTESHYHYHIQVAAGENWHHFVNWCVDREINGLENLALIPGTVGAAPIQNIGAYGVEVERFIESVEYIELATQTYKTLSKEDCQFAYRDSIFKSELAGKIVITQVNFIVPKLWEAQNSYAELAKLVSPSAKDIYHKVIATRKSKLPDPAEKGNAGSFFKNPVISQTHFKRLQGNYSSIPSYPVDASHVKVPAAWLIDTLGFKGQRLNEIGCHPNQALVLFNNGDGVGKDLLKLARKIRDKVIEEFDICLEVEVRLIGKDGMVTL